MVELVFSEQKNLKPSSTVLIRSQTLGYLAQIAYKKAQSFMVYFHSESLLLEKVITQGSIAVEVDFLSGPSFLADLKLLKLAEKNEEFSLMQMDLRQEIEAKPKARLCPMT